MTGDLERKSTVVRADDPKWFEHPVTKSRMRQMLPPFDNIWIGTDPCDGFTKELADSFDVIFNVSCSACAYFEPSRPGQFMHWSPVNEIGNWGYKHFWFAKKVLDYHHERKHKIYLHCHAGACRSPNTFIWWLTSRGYTIQEACLIESRTRITPERLEELKKDKSFLKYRERHYVEEGNIPKHLDKLWTEMNNNPEWSMAGHLLKLEDIDPSNEIACDGHRKLLKHYERWKYYYAAKSRLKEMRGWILRRLKGRVRLTVKKEYFSIIETVPRKEKAAKLAELKIKHGNSKIVID